VGLIAKIGRRRRRRRRATLANAREMITRDGCPVIFVSSPLSSSMRRRKEVD
jgi:hypothetical protein